VKRALEILGSSLEDSNRHPRLPIDGGGLSRSATGLRYARRLVIFKFLVRQLHDPQIHYKLYKNVQMGVQTTSILGHVPTLHG
jgi:hypothetical protein